MCGIFGYVGYQTNVAQLVLEGLKALEYRGYDSWGIAVEDSGYIRIEKHVGRIGQMSVNGLPQSNFGLGHTRWATHGGVTAVNAHPHFDCLHKIAVVHNGIVENYQEIRSLLEKRHKIISETDTEIVAHLIEEYHTRYTLAEAVRKAFLKCRGLSAFVVAESATKKLIAIKNGSPLVLGVGKNENVIGSDVNCLLPLTRDIIFIEDNQLVEVTKDHLKFSAAENRNRIRPKIQKITWAATEATKGNFPHFMLKEIYEQPKVLKHILYNFRGNITRFSQLLRKSPRVYLVGCGSAHYAAITGSYLFSKLCKKEVIPVPGSEFIYKESFVDQKTLTIFLSQSGETIDIIEPLKRLRQRGIKTATLVNVFGSSLYRMADENIWLEAGPEICVLSTKAFTAKLAILGLLAFDMAQKINEGYRLLKKSITGIEQVLDERYQKRYVHTLARMLKNKQHIYTIGRGISYPLALEAALKIKEVSYIHTEGFAAGELKHGVIALIEKGSPCLVFAPADETYEATLSSAMEIKSRGGYIIGISSQNNNIFDFYIPVSECGPFAILEQAIVGQTLGYTLGILRGCDPDKPRNLAKSVTVK